MPMGTNYSPAALALGFGSTGIAAVPGLGGLLQRQVGDETDEERRKRMLGLSALQSGSPALQSLLGNLGGLGGGRTY